MHLPLSSCKYSNLIIDEEVARSCGLDGVAFAVASTVAVASGLLDFREEDGRGEALKEAAVLYAPARLLRTAETSREQQEEGNREEEWGLHDPGGELRNEMRGCAR